MHGTPRATRRRATRSHRRPRPGSPLPRRRSGHRRRPCAGPAAGSGGSRVGDRAPAAVHAPHRDPSALDRPPLQPQHDPGLERIRAICSSGVSPAAARPSSGQRRASASRPRSYAANAAPRSARAVSARSVVAPATLDHRSRARAWSPSSAASEAAASSTRTLTPGSSTSRASATTRPTPSDPISRRCGARRIRSARSASNDPAATRCSSAASITVTSPPARSSSEVAIRPSSSRRVAAGIRRTTTSRIRSWASRSYRRRRSRAPAPRGRRSRDRIDPRASRQGPRARARRPAGRGSRGSRAAGWRRRRAPASWPPRPRRRRACRPPHRRAGRARTATAGPFPERRRLGRTDSRPTGHQPEPSSRSSGWTCRVMSGDWSPMTVASEAAKRSVVGDGREATTTPSPGRSRPSPGPGSGTGRARAGRPIGGRRRRGPPRAAERAADGRTRKSGWRRAADLGPRVEQAMERPILAGRRSRRSGEPRPAARSTRVRSRRTDRCRRHRAPPGFVQEPRLPDPGCPTRGARPRAVPAASPRPARRWPPPRPSGRRTPRPRGQATPPRNRPHSRRRRAGSRGPGARLEDHERDDDGEAQSSSRETRKTRLSSARAAVEVGPSASNSSAIFFVRGPT